MKKEERILLFSDNGKKVDLDRTAEAVCNSANDLISTLHAFQSWRKITNIEQFESLCQDPIKYMDDILIEKSGVNLAMTGGVLPVPSMVAQLLGIDRESYVRIIKGETVSESSCKPCSKIVRVSKSGKGVLSFTLYSKHRDLLQFVDGRFIVDEDAVAERKKSFDYYLDNEEDIKERDFWYNACNVLNELHKRGCLGGDLNNLSKTLAGMMTFSYAVGKLSVDDMALYNKISNLK